MSVHVIPAFTSPNAPRSAVALITGGGTGIGRAIALALARRGAKAVAISYNISEDDARQTCDALTASGVDCLAVKADVRIDSDVRRLIMTVVESFGGIDILVNNAGVTRYVSLRDLEAMTDDIWNLTFDTNLRGTFYCCRAAAPHLRVSNGVIINVASMAGLRGAGSSLAYAVSKAGVIHMTRVLAVALAPEIRVNCVAPGLVKTRWFERGIGEETTEAEMRRVSSETPLARTAMPEDVADSVLGLLASRHVTGQNIVIDGGKSLTYD
jgi:3-oxoacyl-[acyl-carrier protein] reductase